MADTIGKTLRDARQQKGLSIEQLSQLTHIKIRFLEALENDQLDLIPSLVQAKGFIRLYADQVGLSPQALINQLNPPAPLPAENPVFESQPQTQSEKRPNQVVDQLKKVPSIVKSKIPASKPRQPITPTQPQPVVIPPSTDLNSQKTFIEIGRTIRSRRESLGLSLADVEEFIHVREYYLKMIEEGQYQELPSLVQARGMLTNYLNFLDLDTEALMLRFADGLQFLYREKSGDQKPQKQKKSRGIPTGWRRFLTTDLILGAGVILSILIFTIWGAYQISTMADAPGNQSAESISKMLIQTRQVAITGTVTLNAVKMGPADQAAAGLNKNNDQTDAKPTSTMVFTGSGSIQLYIVPNQRTYMRVTVDGKTVFDGRTVPGNAYPYSGSQQIELLTGNAGALKISYLLNGAQNEMGTFGTIGEAKSVIFTNQGIISPTPKFTAAPTGTPQPSQTPQPSSTPNKPTITPYIPKQ